MRITDTGMLGECRRRIQTKQYLLRIKADEYGDVYVNDWATPFLDHFVIAISTGIFMYRSDKGVFGIEPVEIYVFPKNVLVIKNGEHYLLNTKNPFSRVFIHTYEKKKNGMCFTCIIDGRYIAQHHGLTERYLHNPAILPNVLRGMFPEQFTAPEGKEAAMNEKLFQ